METLRRLLFRLRALLSRHRLDDVLQEELNAHLAMLEDDYVRAGLTREEARRNARLRLGGIEQTKESVRDQRSTWLDTFWIDLRYAGRVLRRSPAFTGIVVLTLALGIGANTAVFGLVQAVLLRPLPYERPDRLISIGETSTAPDPTQRRPERGILGGAAVDEFRTRATMLAGLAVMHAYGPGPTSPIDVFLPGSTERLRGGLVTSNFFSLLGVRAHIGRVFDRKDSEAQPVAVLSDSCWRTYFASDPNVIGRTVEMRRTGRSEVSPQRFTIIGVLPPRFRFTYPRETQIWGILPWRTIDTELNHLAFAPIARLRDGASATQAQAELTRLMRERRKADKVGDEESRAQTIVLATPLPELAAADARPGVLLLSVVAVVVLLIACIDVVLLLLARVVERDRELAVRRAMGAGTGRLARQLLTETGVLVAMGAGLGVLLVFVLQPTLRALVPSAVTRGDELAVDVPVLAFSLGLSVLLTLVCGLAPLWHASAVGLHEKLKQAFSNASASRRVAAWRQATVAIQVAVVLVLLVSAALLLHSFWRLQHVDLGYNGTNVLSMEMWLGWDDWTVAQAKTFEHELLEKVRALPGTIDASLTSTLPMQGTDFVMVVGAVGGKRHFVNRRWVDTHYFDLMRIPIVAGRQFTESDSEKAPPVAIVSRSYAKLMFGEGSALGQYLQFTGSRAQIVGIAGEVRHQSPKRSALPAFYTPRAQAPGGIACLVMRTRADLGVTTATVRKVIHDLAPRQPVERVATLDGIVRETTADDRFYTVVTASFAVIALVLAVAGLFGVVRRGVVERTKELAIRMTLGAAPRALVRATLAQELRPVGVGVAFGLVGAYWLSRLLTRFLFEISALEPGAYLLAVALLIAVATAACYVPARRVTRLDPLEPLKAE